MSIGSLGILGGAAGTPLAQTKGSDVDRAEQDTNDQKRQVTNELKAESAAGIAETDGQEHGTNERDADGRRPWEFPAKKHKASDGASDPTQTPTPQSKDPSGDSGGQLDLTG
jgi:hypothetical protein